MLLGTERFPMHSSSRVSIVSVLIALILLLCAKSMSLSIVVPDPPEVQPPVEVQPDDTAKVSFTALHTSGRNWLQVQVAPVGACQKIVVDSVRVLESGLPKEDSSPVFHIGAPRRDVRVWWRLLQESNTSASKCGNVVASRFMVELPRPPSSPGGDTLLAEWAPAEVEAVGPGGRTSRSIPDIVDQSANMLKLQCPMINIVCPIAVQESTITTGDATIAARDAFLANVRTQFGKGLPVVHIKGTGDSIRVQVPLESVPDAGHLGPRTIWKAGNEASVEEIPARTVRSWGSESPTIWRKRTGRVFYKWFNNPGVCCDNCDSLCLRGSYAEGISSWGADVELSNDSTRFCNSGGIRKTLKKDLQGEWLVFPDSSELKTGLFTTALEYQACFAGRVRAYPIHGDSVDFSSRRVALALLDEVVLGTVRSLKSRGFQIAPTKEGLAVVHSGCRQGETWTVRIITPDGKTHLQATSTSPEMEIRLPMRGILFVQVSGAQENSLLRTFR